MSSNLVNFLVALKKREKWRKAAKKAGLSKDAIKTLGSGDATKIEGWLAGEGKATKPIGGESGGS